MTVANRDTAVPADLATYKHWSVSLWRDPDDVSHCRILSPDKTEWRLISAEDAFLWLTSYGSWNAYEKKKKKWLYVIYIALVCVEVQC